MITAKQLNGTYPHQQMRGYLRQTHPDDTPQQHGARLSALVKKWLTNYHAEIDGAWRVEQDGVPIDIDNSFTCGNTPEGFGFWAAINRFGPIEAPVKAKAAPRKKVGWWV